MSACLAVRDHDKLDLKSKETNLNQCLCVTRGGGKGGRGWRGRTSKQWAIGSVPLDRSRIFRRSQNVMGLTGRIQAPTFCKLPMRQRCTCFGSIDLICIQLSLLGIGSDLSQCLCGLKDMHGFHKMTRFIQSTE